jgi:hypothetical protein
LAITADSGRVAVSPAPEDAMSGGLIKTTSINGA